MTRKTRIRFGWLIVFITILCIGVLVIFFNLPKYKTSFIVGFIGVIPIVFLWLPINYAPFRKQKAP